MAIAVATRLSLYSSGFKTVSSQSIEGDIQFSTHLLYDILSSRDTGRMGATLPSYHKGTNGSPTSHFNQQDQYGLVTGL